MKSLAKWIGCGAAVVLAAGSADAASVCGTHLHRRGNPLPVPTENASTYVLTEGEGAGAGGYQLPPLGNGSASVQLFDETGRLAYLIRADLVRSGEMPPAGMPEQGGFHGILIAVEADGSLTQAALVIGKWVRAADGSGTFGADIEVFRSEEREQRLVAVGAIEGVLRSRMAEADPTGAPGLRKDTTAARSRLSAVWMIDP